MNRIIISDIAPWFLTGTIAVLFGILLISIPKLVKEWIRLPRAIGLLLLVIVGLGTYIRFSWVPNTHRIYFDEDRYLMYAVSFARTGHALGIQYATPERIIKGDPDPGARVTVPMIHAWVMRVFGYSDINLFTTAKIESSIQILLIFIFTLLLFGRPVAALIAAFGMAFLPVTVFWSTTTNLDSFFVFFALISGVALMLHLKKPTIITSILLFTSVSLLFFVRIEGLLFIPIMITAFSIVRKSLHNSIVGKHDILFFLLFIPLVAVRVFVALPLFSQTWCCAEATPLEIFQVGYFWRNTIPNLQALFTQPEFPYIITILAFITLFGDFPDRKKWILFIWMLCYFFLYSFYYAGGFFSYTFSGSYGRFFLMLIPPLVILASLSIDDTYRRFQKASFKQKNTILGLCILALLTLYPTILRYRAFITISPWDAMVDEGPRTIRSYLVNTMLPNTPTPAVIIHPLTAAPLMKGKSTVSLEAFLFQKKAQEFVTEQIKKGIPVLLFETGTCNTNPAKCAAVNEQFTFTPYPIGDSQLQGIDVSKVELKIKK